MARIMSPGDSPWCTLLLLPATHNLVVVGSSPTRPTIYGVKLLSWATVALNGIGGLIAIFTLFKGFRDRSKRNGATTAL